MKKWKKILVIVLVSIGIIFICFLWILREAFGPKYRNVEIKIDDNRTLHCSETYNADMAAVFYDVDFILEDKTNKNLKLGSCTFGDDNWEKKIKLHNIADWIVLTVSDNSYAKILMTNKCSEQNKDTTLYPIDLRYDSIWKTVHNDNLTLTYTDSSKVDSVVNDKFYFTYEYRIGDNQPFKFYSQTIEYRLDTVTAKLNTIKVNERYERNGNR